MNEKTIKELAVELLFKVSAIDEDTYKPLVNKCGTIRRKLISSITTVKNKTTNKL